ncbi:MAG: hypothetical protein J6038_03185, partial [Bacilli bacterium]|nr:hypothetical protein [Bacilli bacterium]
LLDIFGVKSSMSTEPETSANYHIDFDPKGVGYYHAKDEKKMTPFTYRDINYSCGMDNIVSKGQAKLLCVPVEFTDYPFYGGANSAYSSKAEMESDFNIAFNGEPEDTGYWESLASFYKKTSYGKFDLTVDFCDIYKTNLTAEAFARADAPYRDETGNYVQAAKVIQTLQTIVENLRSSKGDAFLKQYDNDKDGWIDGIIMMYSCPDFKSDASIRRLDATGNTFWAYAYWAATEFGEADSPTANLFFWASHSFLHEAAKKPKVDCHTIIHEFGHMLGLDDYYPSGTSNWNAAGGLSMMDENILDHDMFSKTALGWTEPLVVTGKQNVTWTIGPSETTGDCIIIPAGDCWNQTAFSEYLILDLYTPVGLNEKDSTYQYSNRTLGYTIPGVRIHHVDARVAVYSTYPTPTWSYYLKDSLANPQRMSYQVAASNCYKGTGRCDDSFSLLSLIDAKNVKNFRRGDMADNDSLFQSGDTFTFQKYSTYFPNRDKWNDGSAATVSIVFQSVSATSAEISFSF